MKTIALYARVSSEQQAQQATIESQLGALRERAIADRHRVLPGDEYIDNGFSGATLVRPALERLRDRIVEGAIDIIYVHRSRSARAALRLPGASARGVRRARLLRRLPP